MQLYRFTIHTIMQDDDVQPQLHMGPQQLKFFPF